MGDTARAEQLLLEVMGVVGEDAQLPLPILVNLHREQLRAPLERLAEANKGRASDPWLQAVRVLGAVEKRWPSLARGDIFTGSDELNRLAQQIPDAGVNIDYEYMVQLTREPSPVVVHLSYDATQGWNNCEPIILLHTLTWRDTDGPTIMLLIELLAVELELDPAVEDMIRAYLPA